MKPPNRGHIGIRSTLNLPCRETVLIQEIYTKITPDGAFLVVLYTLLVYTEPSSGQSVTTTSSYTTEDSGGVVREMSNAMIQLLIGIIVICFFN